MRTSFHHQPEAQHPNSSAIHKLAGRLPHLLAITAESTWPSTGSLPSRSRPLPQPHTPAAAVLINEFDAGAFKSSSNDIKGGATRLTRPSLQLVHSYDTDSGFICKVLLAPSKKSPGGPGLFRSDHPENHAASERFLQFCKKCVDYINSKYYLWFHRYFIT
jgi:hypothetical protein